jgi:hypothetical protein
MKGLSSALVALGVTAVVASTGALSTGCDRGASVNGTDRVTPASQPPSEAASPTALPASVRRFESSQGYEAVIPAEWTVLPNVPLVGGLMTADYFAASSEWADLVGMVAAGEISREEYARRESQLEEWGFITVMSSEWEDGPPDLPVEFEAAVASWEMQREEERTEDVTIDGNDTILHYYRTVAEGGSRDMATVGFVDRGRYWAIAMNVPAGRLEDFLPAYETFYTSFRIR